jgi:hypothetical protein
MDSRQHHPAIRPWDGRWHRFLWTLIGFAAGTGLAAPLILSIEPRDRVIGGMFYGGIPLGVVGLLYGRRRSGRLSEVSQDCTADAETESKNLPRDQT